MGDEGRGREKGEGVYEVHYEHSVNQLTSGQERGFLNIILH